MSENNEVVIEVETETENIKKPDFLIDESEMDTDTSDETDMEPEERTIETVEAELEALKEDLKKQLEAVAETEREQYEEERERLLRTAAEAENSKRRTETEAQKQLKFANKNIIEGLIPVLDSFEAAIKSVDGKIEASETSSDFSNFSEGVQLVHKQLLDVLKTHSLIAIEAAVGDSFDPNQHEAVFATESDEVAEGNVIEEFRCGYQLHDQVLRAAQVVVSKGKPEQQPPTEENEEQETEDIDKD
ncbi:MAG: nucleotide exchange factor GrpE [Candidatus Poribacteria bacterium]|nr:nucleotide exchange factor GrpE [Candidatus Poribacteria bacterium]